MNDKVMDIAWLIVKEYWNLKGSPDYTPEDAAERVVEVAKILAKVNR